jgi:hypothetical protein
MAYQSGNKKLGAQVLRTPAPVITQKSGGLTYGSAQDTTPSSIDPSKSVTSELGKNMRESSDPNDLLGTIARSGVAGRGDSIPVDDNRQTRKLELSDMAPSHGMARQQMSINDIPRSLPTKLGANVGKPVRNP